MKIFSTFTGYGGAEWGLKLAKITYELVGYSEINKYAIQCFEQNFPENKGKNYGDISKINWKEVPDFDLLTGGFPCQDVSFAGKRDLSKGRTLLVNNLFIAMKKKKPKYVLFENVKGLLSSQPLWDNIRHTINKLGYQLAYKVLNSKEHGVPQNRERIWIIGIRNDIYKPFKFHFPYKEELKLNLKDILEEKVDNKYYLKKEKSEKLLKSTRHTSALQNNKCANTLAARDYKEPKCIVYSLYPRSSKTGKGGTGQLLKYDNTSYCVDTVNCQAISCAIRQQDRHNKNEKKGQQLELNTEEYANSLTSVQKDSMICYNVTKEVSIRKYKTRNKEIALLLRKHKKISINEISKKLKINKSKVEHWFRKDKGFSLPNKEEWFKLKKILNIKNNNYDKEITTMISKPNEFESANRVYDSKGISPTLTCSTGENQSKKIINNKNIRRLTPRECFRLMGFLKDEINLEGISNSQLYKLAGNGWDVNLVSKIFKNLFKEDY